MHKDRLYIRQGRRLIPLDSPGLDSGDTAIDLSALRSGARLPDIGAPSGSGTLSPGTVTQRQPSDGGNLPPSSMPSPPRRQGAAVAGPGNVAEPQGVDSPPVRAGAMAGPYPANGSQPVRQASSLLGDAYGQGFARLLGAVLRGSDAQTLWSAAGGIGGRALGASLGGSLLAGPAGALGAQLGGGVLRTLEGLGWLGAGASRAGQSPAQPVYTRDVGLQALLGELLSATRALQLRGMGAGVNDAVAHIEMQRLRAGAREVLG